MKKVARSSRKNSNKKKKFTKFRERRCRFQALGVEFVDWKDTATLQRLCSGQGKLLSRKRSGTSARFQRMVRQAVKRARFMGLLPYVGN